ncbi:MAG: hypothetical protein HZC17_09755, partial [Candidatus Omnitrophica bacterium]|nr:hypothetical protein [Candidatus Omnitrophota bacterium]
SLFMRVLTQLDFFELYQAANTPLLDLVAMNLVMILIITFFVPTFSAMMIRGASGFSGAGGAVLGFGGAMLIRQASRGVRGINLMTKKQGAGLARQSLGQTAANKSYKGVT